MANKKGRVSLLAILCTMAVGVGLSMWQQYFANKPKEEDEVVNKFIISKNTSVKSDKEGNYIYESLDGKSIGLYQKIIPTSYWEEQENKCIINLLEKKNEQVIDTCSLNGYTYLLLSYGLTDEVVEFQSEPFIETENELILRYRFTINDGGYSEKTVFYIFQVPTNKEIKFEPLSTLTEEELDTPFIKYMYERNEEPQEDIINNEQAEDILFPAFEEDKQEVVQGEE